MPSGACWLAPLRSRLSWRWTAPGSVSAGALDHGTQSPDKDRQVHREGPVLDVEEVLTDRLLPREIGAAADLPPPGDAGLDEQPAVYVRLVARDLARQRRPRADQAHVALDDVEQLRQLVERPLAQEAADRRDPRVVADLEQQAVALVEVLEL